MESISQELGITVLAVISLLRNLHGILSSSPLEPPRASHAQIGIEISSLRIDINNEICTMPTRMGHVSIKVDPASFPQALITSDMVLPSDTTSVWPILDSERFELDVRPSSRLLFTLHEGRSSKNIRCSFFAPVAELFAGVSDEGSCIYEARNTDGRLLLRFTLILVIKNYPQYSRPTPKESTTRLSSDSITEDSSSRLFSLADEKHRFTDVFSREVGATLGRLIVFLDKHAKETPSLSTIFLWSTMSVFWRITQDLGPHESQSSSTDTSPVNSPPTTQSSPTRGHWSKRCGEVPSGGEYPLRNIVLQMNFLLGLGIPNSGPGRDDLLLAIRRELCLCVAVLEAYIESYRGMTWQIAHFTDQAHTFVERQYALFLLGRKCVPLTHEPEQYNRSFGEGKQLIERILSFAVKEGLDRKVLEYGRESRKESRFAVMLLSARDRQCDHVWDIVFEILQQEKDQEKRYVYRHILIRLVQAADRILGSLWVNQGGLVVSKENPPNLRPGAFASVYMSQLEGKDVVVKCLHALGKTPTNIDDRRKVYLEIVSRKILQHTNLLPFVGVCRARLQGGEILGELCMVSPYMDKGTLRSCYAAVASDVNEASSRTTPKFDLNVRMQHIQQVASGMAYLHEEGVVHGDLRGDNIFLDGKNNVQIADFGLFLFSTGFSCNYYSMRTENIRWTAPELVAPQCYPMDAPQQASGSDITALELPDDDTMPRRPFSDTFLKIERPTMRSDVFSFSCVCIEVFAGKPPFDEIDDPTIRKKVYDGKLGMPSRPMSMESDAFWNLVIACRSNFASERPTFVKIEEALLVEEILPQLLRNHVQSRDVEAWHLDIDLHTDLTRSWASHDHRENDATELRVHVRKGALCDDDLTSQGGKPLRDQPHSHGLETASKITISHLECTKSGIQRMMDLSTGFPEANIACKRAYVMFYFVVKSFREAFAPNITSIDLYWTLHDTISLARTQCSPEQDPCLDMESIIHDISVLTAQSAEMLYAGIRSSSASELFHSDQELTTHYIARLRAIRRILQPMKIYTVMVFEITSLKINGWHSAAPRISLQVSLDDTESVQPPPEWVTLDATSAWEQSDPGKSLWMVVRPSSRIQVEIFDAKNPDSDHATLCTSIPLAELVASGAGEAEASYEILDENGKTLLTLVITADIRYYAKLQDLERQESAFNATGLSLENTPTIIGPYQATHVATDLLRLLYQHREKIHSRIFGFLSSAAPAFTRIMQHLESQTDDFRTQPRDGTVEYHKDLLQDLMTQMITSIRLLRSLEPMPESFNGEYISGIFRELCRCIGILEGVIGHTTKPGLAGEVVIGFGGIEYVYERQQRLFLLLSAIAFQIRGTQRMQIGKLDRSKTVEQLLALIKEESQRYRHNDQPTTELELRLFTSILTSVRGAESDRVFSIIEELLQREPDAASRDAHRWALIKLVQAAGRLPTSLWISVETSASQQNGEGGFADVYKGRIPGSGLDVAVKSLRGTSNLLSNVRIRMRLYNEIIFWKTLRHDRLLPFLGLCTYPDAGNVCMVSPFMSNGTLLANCDETTPSATRLRYITEIVEGMTYLHGEGVVHGSLRAVNILLDDNSHIVIADFGLSVVVAEDDSDSDYSARAVNPKWTAPELLFSDDYSPEIKELQPGSEAYIRAWYRLTRPTKQSDVYNFAFLCIEVYTGQEPFPGWRGDQYVSQLARNRKLRPGRPSLMTNAGLWILVQDCWAGEAAKRPSFKQIQEKLRRLLEFR